MSLKSLTPADLTGSREIHFSNRQESDYPTLMRFSLDFNLRVLQLQRDIDSHSSQRPPQILPEFLLVCTKHSRSGIAFTPTCASLQALEEYVANHQTDILHDYLFGVDSAANIS
jgi:hypothetical protein